jgi:hypothetical protein
MPPQRPAPEPVSVLAQALPRPHLLRRRRDVAFLHWAVRPDAVAGFFAPDVEPDVLDGLAAASPATNANIPPVPREPGRLAVHRLRSGPLDVMICTGGHKRRGRCASMRSRSSWPRRVGGG